MTRGEEGGKSGWEYREALASPSYWLAGWSQLSTPHPLVPVSSSSRHQRKPFASCGPSRTVKVSPSCAVLNLPKLVPGPKRKLRPSMPVPTTTTLTPTSISAADAPSAEVGNSGVASGSLDVAVGVGEAGLGVRVGRTAKVVGVIVGSTTGGSVGRSPLANHNTAARISTTRKAIAK